MTNFTMKANKIAKATGLIRRNGHNQRIAARRRAIRFRQRDRRGTSAAPAVVVDRCVPCDAQQPCCESGPGWTVSRDRHERPLESSCCEVESIVVVAAAGTQIPEDALPMARVQRSERADIGTSTQRETIIIDWKSRWVRLARRYRWRSRLQGCLLVSK